MSDSPEATDAVAELGRCRDEIEIIDRGIIELLARRMLLGRRTGDLKRVAGLPILDPTREAAVIRRVAGEAREAGLPTEPIREIFWQIVGMSRRAQEWEETSEVAPVKPEEEPVDGSPHASDAGASAGEGTSE